MAIEVIASQFVDQASTSSGINTTGADCLLVFIARYSTAPTFTDNKGNTFTPHTEANFVGDFYGRFYICLAPAVGTGHTFTLAGTAGANHALVIALSGVKQTSPIDNQVGGGFVTSSPVATGSLTPSVDGCILVACGANYNVDGDFTAINSGFTLLHHGPGDYGNHGYGLAYKIQTTAGAENANWTVNTPSLAGSVMIALKPVPAPDTTKPSDVTGLTATKISNSRIDIDSNSATDNIAVAGYQTQVSLDAGGTWTTLSDTTKAFQFEYGDTGFPSSVGTHSLTFRRKAFDTADPANYSNDWSNIPTAVSITITAPPPVANFTITPTTVVIGGTVVLTDTSTNSPTSRQWKLDDEDLATTTPYNLNTTGLTIGIHTVDLEVSNSGGSDEADSQTFTVIDSFIAEHFEEFKLCKLFNITDLELEIALLSADFGDGYGAGVLSGNQSGLRKWAISADPLLDLTEYNMSFIVDEETQTDTPLNYFWEFFRRHIALGNKPFYFTDPRTSRKFLASFVEPRLSLRVFTKAIYGTGIQIKQRRFVMEDLNFRAEDGSIDE